MQNVGWKPYCTQALVCKFFRMKRPEVTPTTAQENGKLEINAKSLNDRFFHF